MRGSQDRNGSISFQTVAVIAVVFILGVVVLTSGNTTHVASNPGPSGTPGSTLLDQTPPPAAGPSETTGAAR